MTKEEWYKQLFEHLEASKFRSSFHLKKKDIDYINERGLDVIRQHAQDFIVKREAPAFIPNDGKQTPMRGHPDKSTAMRLCVGAELNLDETKDLLARAGYALSPCDKRDIIFSYFIENEYFDMIEIDIALEEHGLPCFIE